MKHIGTFFKVTFSISGPLIISFGTYAGLLQVLDVSGFENRTISDGWIYCGYLVLLYVGAVMAEFSLHDRQTLRLENSVAEDNIVVITNSPQQGVLRSFFTAGLSRLIRWITEKNGIIFYDVFAWPSYWPRGDDEYRSFPIVRLHKQSESFEIRFPKSGNGRIHVRKTTPGNDRFGEFHDVSLKEWPVLFALAPFSSLRQLF